MNTELLNNVADFFKPAAEAARTMNRLNVATIEKVTSLQLACIQANAELAIANFKAGIEVTDLDGIKAYSTRQNELVKTVYERMVADSKVFASIAKDYSAEASKLVKDVVPAAPIAAVVAPRAKKAAA